MLHRVLWRPILYIATLSVMRSNWIHKEAVTSVKGVHGQATVVALEYLNAVDIYVQGHIAMCLFFLFL